MQTRPRLLRASLAFVTLFLLGLAGTAQADTCVVETRDLAKAHVKSVTCPEGLTPDAERAARLHTGGLALTKTGARFELRPLSNPAVLRPGRLLALRVYSPTGPGPGAEVVALGPEQKRVTAVTDALGQVKLTIPAAGKWRVVYEEDGHRAELLVDVAPAELWEGVTLDSLVRTAAPVVPVKNQASNDVWRELGPSPILTARDTGRIAAVVTAPGGRYYAGAASGGIWKSSDNGASWRPLGDDLPMLSIGAMAIDPTNPQIIYAGSGEANYAYHSLYGRGLYKSVDGGETWKVLGRNHFAGRTFSRLVVSPFDPQDVWAAVGRAGGTFEGNEGARRHPRGDGPMGIYRSRDGGETWQQLRARHGVPAYMASDIDLDPTDARRVWASFGDPFARGRNGIYRSDDGGETFSLVTPDLPGGQVGRITLALSPSDPDRVYALVVSPSSRERPAGFSPGGSSTYGVLRSDDGGDTWTLKDPGNFQNQQGIYNAVILVHPQDPDTFFLGGVQMLRSRDGGDTYDVVTPPHVDLHDFVFDRGGRLVTAGDGGIHRTKDLGDTWSTLNEGLATVQIYAGLSVHPTDPNVFLAGFQDNGTGLRLGDDSEWIEIFGGDGGYTAIHPDNPQVLFVEYQGPANIVRSEDGGLTFLESWAGISAGDRTCFLPPFVIDPQNPERMLYATQRIYESTDGGRNWNAISGDLTAGAPAAVRSLIMAPSNSAVVWAGTNDGRVLVSTDGGADWTLVRENIAGWPRVTRQIAVDPLRPAQAFVGVMGFGGERLLRTLDRGQTWTDIGRGLPDLPINTVAVHRVAEDAGVPGPRSIFAGTDVGVFWTQNEGATWQPYGSGGTRAPVTDLVVDAARGRLVVSTLGRGAWTIGLP